MTRKTPTFAQCLGRAFASAFVLVALGAATVFVPSLFDQSPGPVTGDRPSVMDTRPNAVGSAPYLAERNDCWGGPGAATADAPEGVVPGHVVITRPDASVPEIAGPVEVGAALDAMFADGPAVDFEVHAFCR